MSIVKSIYSMNFEVDSTELAARNENNSRYFLKILFSIQSSRLTSTILFAARGNCWAGNILNSYAKEVCICSKITKNPDIS